MLIKLSSRVVGELKFDYLLNNFHGVPVKACNCEAFMMFKSRRLTMNRFTFSTFFVAAGLAGIFQNANAQAINATVQTSAPRVAANRARASGSGKACCGCARGAEDRPAANRFEPSKV